MMKKLLSTSLFISGLLSASLVMADLNTGQIIVKFKPTSGDTQVAITADKMQSLSSSLGSNITHKRNMSGGAEVFSISSSLSDNEVTQLLVDLNERSDVEYASPDTVMRPLVAPVDDPDFSKQWYLFPVGSIGASNLSPGAVDAQTAWTTATNRGTGIVIAILDTGLLVHEDLVTTNGEDFIENFSVDADGINGRDADATDPGDFLTEDDILADSQFFGCTSGDSSWHGTLVAGVIGAQTNNTLGIAGIAGNATLLMGRVLGKCGGFTSDIIDGIRWAAGLTVANTTAPAQKADIINLSLGGGGACSTAMQTAIDDVIATGTVIVTAAGNEGKDAALSSPGNCRSTINVASNTRRGARAPYTNFGTDVDIAAPGGNTAFATGDGIYTTSNSGTTVEDTSTTTAGEGQKTYASVQGTSFAAPVVSGTIALMLEAAGGSGSLTPTQIYGTLLANTTSFPTSGFEGNATNACTTSTCGIGITNAKAAVEAVNAGSISNTAFPTRSALATQGSTNTTVQPLFSPNTGSSAITPWFIFFLLATFGLCFKRH